MKPGTIVITSLTPLRGIAALLVAVYHFNGWIIAFVQPTNSLFVAKCYMMVDLFFIMSGFIIMHVYKETFTSAITLKAFKNFIIARFARIYPLHFFTLFVLIVFFYIRRGGSGSLINNPAAIPTNLLLLQSFGIHKFPTWNVPSWSISAEWWAYVAFPVMCLFLFKKRILAIIVMILFIVMTYISIMYFLPRHDPFNPAAIVPPTLDATYNYGFLRGLAGFMIGMLIYLSYLNIFIKKLFGSDIFCVICISLVVVIMHFGLSDLIFIPMFAMLVLSLACNNSTVSKVFNNRILQFLGNISYSIYLTHAIICLVIILALNLLQIRSQRPIIFPFLTGASLCLVYLLLVIAVSAVTYYIIEKPCRNWINQKWVKRPRTPLAIAVP